MEGSARAADRLGAGAARHPGSRLLRAWIVGLALAPAAALFAAAQPAGASPALPVGHAKRWITDARGRVVIVHGINMVYKLPPYYPAAAGFGAEDAEFLASIGMNAVRLGVIWKALEPEPGVFDEGYLRQIEETVEILAAHGILSLIDMHQDMYNERFEGEGAPDWAVYDEGLEGTHEGFPGNYVSSPALNAAMTNFWSNLPGPYGIGLQDYLAAAWRHLAGRFAGNADILGYDLWNEPWPGKGFINCENPTRGCPKFDATLSSFYSRVASAVREADPSATIYREPNVIFNFGAPTRLKALKAGNAGFAFHDYCLNEQPNGCESERTVFENALGTARRTREALLLDEFGAVAGEGDLNGMVAMADRDMVPWTEWDFCKCGDPTGADLDPLVIDAHEPPAGANLGQLALRTLVEPYPQVIAGTPTQWHFDRSTGTFSLDYLTKGPRREFKDGAITDIAVPQINYPSGYAVHVQGAAVASAPGAPVLELAQAGRARSVSVTVEPG